MGGKSHIEQRKFTINGREYWLTKDQVQGKFGCSAENVEDIWNEGTLSKATEWLNYQKTSTAKPYRSAWRRFEEFTGMTSDQIFEDRKSDKDYKWERKVVEFKQWLLNTGRAPYTATQHANAIRGFFAYHRMRIEPTKSESRRLSERRRKTEDYKFSVEDLKRMYDHAKLHEKYILVAGKSFGLRVGDFLRLTRGHFDALNLEQKAPIALGEYATQKEAVSAFPFIDTDTKPVITYMLEKMTREGRTNVTERMLSYKREKELTQVLKRLAKRAGLKTGNKRVRFHCLRKFLIDNISSLMSESKWKQIVGKKISESAYVSPEGLREDYARAMSKTTFTKTVVESDVELLAKKQALIMLAKLQGASEDDMKKIFRSKKAVTTKEQVKALEEFTEQNKSSNNDCLDGEHCQCIVKEGELETLLAQGWQVAAVLPSGKIVVSNEYSARRDYDGFKQ